MSKGAGTVKKNVRELIGRRYLRWMPSIWIFLNEKNVAHFIDKNDDSEGDSIAKKANQRS